MFQQFFLTAFPEPVRDGVLLALKFAPIWLPVLLVAAFIKLWMTYVRADFIAKQEYCVIELKFPREVQKSPMAMEVVINGIHNQSGEAKFTARWWEGSIRPWWSLEIASIDGNVRFFVWARKSQLQYVESSFYAQYPDIEVVECRDYTKDVPFNLEEMAVWGAYYRLTKPSPYPIKTYVDYGLDLGPKEEEKVDPLNTLVEFLAQCKKGEQIWYQLIIRVNKSEKLRPGKFFEFMDFKKECMLEIDKIYAEPEKQNYNEETGIVMKSLSSSQETDIQKIQTKQSKFAFDVGIRALYVVTDLDRFDPPKIGGIINGFKQFSSETYTGFQAYGGNMYFDYPWQDYNDIRANRTRYKLFDGFRRRSWFYAPYRRPYFNLNTEELATIFHPVGSVLQTPTIERVESKREGPPANLPI